MGIWSEASKVYSAFGTVDNFSLLSAWSYTTEIIKNAANHTNNVPTPLSLRFYPPCKCYEYSRKLVECTGVKLQALNNIIFPDSWWVASYL